MTTTHDWQKVAKSGKVALASSSHLHPIFISSSPHLRLTFVPTSSRLHLIFNPSPSHLHLSFAPASPQLHLSFAPSSSPHHFVGVPPSSHFHLISSPSSNFRPFLVNLSLLRASLPFFTAFCQSWVIVMYHSCGLLCHFSPVVSDTHG